MMKWVVVLMLLGSGVQADTATFLSKKRWAYDDEKFGGVSSLHILEDGKSFLATTDRGQFVQGHIGRAGDVMTEITVDKMLPIQDPAGVPIKGWKSDSEGLAMRKNGRIYVSFEGYHRVWTYSSVTSKAAWLPRHKDFKTLQNNSSLEALAIDAKNRLYTLPERSGKETRPFPVYRYAGGVWDKKLSIPRKGAHLVVGADFGPDGKFYLLERAHEYPISFSTRVRRFTLDANGFSNEETLIETRFGAHDNLEGISVWKDAQNRIRITLVADDNFRFFQNTEIVEFVVN